MEKKLSLLKFAQLLEIEKPNLARIERGGNNITITNLKKIADTLEIPLKDLLDFN
ncbi:MAG: helix-turn-helix transcriptional regulator [Bacteroidetes bacterium]|nr:helix-turn-helix transcriptional regulator [Bacteroidota bacterium]